MSFEVPKLPTFNKGDPLKAEAPQQLADAVRALAEDYATNIGGQTNPTYYGRRPAYVEQWVGQIAAPPTGTTTGNAMYYVTRVAMVTTPTASTPSTIVTDQTFPLTVLVVNVSELGPTGLGISQNLSVGTPVQVFGIYPRDGTTKLAYFMERPAIGSGQYQGMVYQVAAPNQAAWQWFAAHTAS